MATNTPNINLTKPDYTDNADIGVLNANADKIDAAVKTLQDLMLNAQTLITALQTATTPQAILNALKTVDGTGSGLDSDLLDGKHSLEFLQLSNAGRSFVLENANLNDFKLNGEFYLSGSLVNSPTGKSGYLKVESASENYVKQTFTEYDSSTIFIRIFNNVWINWKKIGGDIVKSIQRGTATKVNNQTLNIPINNIEPTKSICHLYISGQGSENTGFQTLSFTLNSNSISLPAFSSEAAQHSFTWQIIEYN